MYFIVQGSARIIFPGLCVAAVTCHNKEASQVRKRATAATRR